VDITDKAGEYFTFTHNLDSTDVIVDITVKTTANGGAHRRHLVLTGLIAGFEETYEGTAIDYGWSMVQTGDGGYAITGSTDSYGVGNGDVWLVKTDASGTAQWTQTYGGTSVDLGLAVVETSDEGYAIAGWTASFGAGSADFWLVKTDVVGESGLAWTDSTADTITLYRGRNDIYWNYVRVRIWKID
jgi:hypothetical protein